MKPLLNIIGAGRVGKTLGYLLAKNSLVKINCILDHNLKNAQVAQDYFQQGKAISQFDELLPANIYMLSVRDENIDQCVNELLLKQILKQDDIIFHCSGALSSELLLPLKKSGALIATVHPIHSFADPKLSIDTFAGSLCTIEGEHAAKEILNPLFIDIGAQIISISAQNKLIYHAGLVLACGGLTALIEASLRSLIASGISREVAMEIINPLVNNTVQQIFSLGTRKALTGPVARGDEKIIAAEIEALKQVDSDLSKTYEILSKVAKKLIS